MFGGLEREGEGRGGEGRGGKGKGRGINLCAEIVKKFVNFGGAAPLPWREDQNLNPRVG